MTANKMNPGADKGAPMVRALPGGGWTAVTTPREMVRLSKDAARRDAAMMLAIKGRRVAAADLDLTAMEFVGMLYDDWAAEVGMPPAADLDGVLR